jgi:hypothetical protein
MGEVMTSPTVIAPELFPERPHWLVQKYGPAIRERHGIDPVLIANDLGLSTQTVLMVQRKLRLRLLTSSTRRTK